MTEDLDIELPQPRVERFSPETMPLTPYVPQLPVIPGADLSRAVLDSFKIAIAKRLSETLPLTLENAFESICDGKNGEDFTVALPGLCLPGEIDNIAAKVTEGFQADEWIESIVHKGKIFLHFRVNTNTMIRKVLDQVNTLTHSTASGQPEYGSNNSGEGKKVIIEYSSPNIAKSFHVGHLRSTIIGAFLANLYKACGWEVISMNYLGDWGTQFGMIATGYEKYGCQAELEKDPIKHLFDVYVKVNKDANTNPDVKAEAAEWFKRMEDGDEEALKNWRIWREMSVKKYEEEYNRLNIKFDVYTGESKVSKASMDKALAQLEQMGLVSVSHDARVVDLERFDLGTPIVRKKDGTSIYLTRDIGGAIERYEQYKFDKMIYVVSSQQDLHLQQTFKVLELMGFPWANSESLVHSNYGLVQGMSTRNGTVVFLDEVIKEAGVVMHEQMQKKQDKYAAVEDPNTTSLELGITGIKIQDMAAKRINNYNFDWDRMKSFEGDTGPYLQYAHVRLASIGRKNPHLLPLPPSAHIATHTLCAYPHAREIAFLLGTYPKVVKVALRTHEPSGVVTYAFRLAHAISRAWNVVIVKGEEDLEKAQAKMYLYECAKEVLAAAMRLLSIRPLERM